MVARLELSPHHDRHCPHALLYEPGASVNVRDELEDAAALIIVSIHKSAAWTHSDRKLSTDRAHLMSIHAGQQLTTPLEAAAIQIAPT